MRTETTAQPVATTVPGAAAERRRMFRDDLSGVTVYAIAIAVVGLALMLAVAFG